MARKRRNPPRGQSGRASNPDFAAQAKALEEKRYAKEASGTSQEKPQPANSNGGYDTALAWADGLTPPPARRLTDAELRDHQRRIASTPDRPLSKRWRPRVDYSDLLGLGLDAKASRVANSMTVDLLLAAADGRFAGVSLNRNTYRGCKPFSCERVREALGV